MFCTGDQFITVIKSLCKPESNGSLFSDVISNLISEYVVEYHFHQLPLNIDHNEMYYSNDSEVIVIDDNICWVTGGKKLLFDSEWKSQNSVKRFNINTYQWLPRIPNMISRREDHITVSLNNIMWSIGGKNGCVRLKSTEYFNPIIQQWIQGPSMLEERRYHCGVSIDFNIYVFGGYLEPMINEFARCEVLSMPLYTYITDYNSEKKKNNVWKSIEDMNVPRAWAGAVVINPNCILVMGGSDVNRIELNCIERYTPSTNTWEILKFKLPVKTNYFNCFYDSSSRNLTLIIQSCENDSKDVYEHYITDDDIINFQPSNDDVLSITDNEWIKLETENDF